MRPLPFLAFGLLLLCGTTARLRAAEPDAPAPSASPNPAAKWSVRVEVLMVALPAEKALPLLPDLRDETKIEAACAHLLSAVQNKEATLTGYPVLYLTEGQRATTQSSVEKIYPTQFSAAGSPTSFEKRNLGPSLEAGDCKVSPDGTWIQLAVLVQRTELLKFDSYDAVSKDNASARIEQPQFYSSKDALALALHTGQRVLVGVHTLTKPEGELELFILCATATPAR